jgi:hypothetical protein
MIMQTVRMWQSGDIVINTDTKEELIVVSVGLMGNPCCNRLDVEGNPVGLPIYPNPAKLVRK